MDTIEIKQDILAINKTQAKPIRAQLHDAGTLMINLMASPGSGKTSVILRLHETLRPQRRLAVIEGDIDSQVDSHKVKKAGMEAVQINTGGACHLDVPMVAPALDLLDLNKLDLVIVENIGNLVCPAEFDIGADLNMMILSVPEGDDKILKYPLMFSMCDALIINKIDYLALPSNNFSVERLKERMKALNPDAPVFSVSSYTGEGFDTLGAWVEEAITYKQTKKGRGVPGSIIFDMP